MQLIDLRSEVLNHGFDPVQFSSRINQYLNDAQALVCRRVQFYTDEGTKDFSTTSGTATYALPTDMAKEREVWDTDRHIALFPVGLRDIDTSAQASNGPPGFYAFDGSNLRLWPVPDAVYNLEIRYWKLPPTLAVDSDTPILPVDWHHILWVYATWMCYEAEDDPNMGQYWQQRFNTELAEFTSDQRFPSTDYPTQAKGMWDSDRPLQTNNAWSVWWNGL